MDSQNFAHQDELTFHDLQAIVTCMDLTLLNKEADEGAIRYLCQKARTDLGDVAAVCVYPQFVPLVKHLLGETAIQICSVANFPTGNESLKAILEQISQAIAAGATEIDMVFPYHLYNFGRHKEAFKMVNESRNSCQNATFKVILETSAFAKDDIYFLSQQILAQRVDFIKTSTGTTHQGATLENAHHMLLAIKDSTSPNAGFKASGGIKEAVVAKSYITLAKKIMGEIWVNPRHFRIGASSLLDDVIVLAKQLM